MCFVDGTEDDFIEVTLKILGAMGAVVLCESEQCRDGAHSAAKGVVLAVYVRCFVFEVMNLNCLVYQITVLKEKVLNLSFRGWGCGQRVEDECLE